MYGFNTQPQQQQMGMGFQQQPQLPSTTQAQQPFLNITLQQPPYVPNIGTIPEMARLLPEIAAAAACEIQNKANTNPLRMFMFNRYAAGNFMNHDFETLVSNIIEYAILLAKFRGGYPNLDSAVSVAIAQITELACAVAVREFPVLQQHLPPQLVQAAVESAQVFDRIGGEIRSFKQSGGWPGMQQQQMQYGAYVQPMQRTGFDPSQGQFHQLPPRQGLSHPGYASTPHQNVSVFNRGSDPLPMQRVVPQGQALGADRYAIDDKRHVLATPVQTTQPTRQEVVQQPFDNRTQAMETPTTEEKRLDIDQWMPKAANAKATETWYLPAINPHLHKLSLQKNDDGLIIPFIEKRSEMLDYSKHEIKTVFGKLEPITKIGDDRFLARVEHELHAQEEAKRDRQAVISEAGGYEPTVEKDTNWIASSNIEECLMSVRLRQFENARDGVLPDVFRSLVSILTPSVSTRDQTAVIKSLGESVTYSELREKLKNAATMNKLDEHFGAIVNKTITATVNRILRQNLSIPKLEMDDFVDDYDALVNYLGKTYGQNVLNAFLDRQKQVIATTFGKTDPITAQELFGQTYDRDAGGIAPVINHIANEYTITLLNCRASELELDLVTGVACALTDQFTPVLERIAANLFEETESKDESQHFHRHLVVTSDGVQLELTKGYLGDIYLITKL